MMGRKQNSVANPLSLLCSRNLKSSRNPNSCQSLLSGPVWTSYIFQFGKCTSLSPSGKVGEVCQCQYQLLHFPVCEVQLGFHQLEGRRWVGLLPLQVPNNYFIFQFSLLQWKVIMYEISAIKIILHVLWSLSLWHNKETTFFNFFLQKWGEVTFYQIKGKINVGNSWILALQWVDWPSKKLLDFHQILYFSFPL